MEKFKKEDHKLAWMDQAVGLLEEHLKRREAATTEMEVDATKGAEDPLAEGLWKLLYTNHTEYKTKHKKGEPRSGRGKVVNIEERCGKKFFLSSSGTWVACDRPPRSSCDICLAKGRGSVKHWHFECPLQEWKVQLDSDDPRP